MSKEEEDFIGIVSMSYKSTGKRSIGLYFDKDCMKELNCSEIIFNPFSLKIFIGNIDSKKTYTITKVSKGGSISFAHKNISNEEFVGTYNMYKEEEHYYLEKQIEIIKKY